MRVILTPKIHVTYVGQHWRNGGQVQQYIYTWGQNAFYVTFTQLFPRENGAEAFSLNEGFATVCIGLKAVVS